MDHVSPYDRFARHDAAIEAWLARGEHREELRAFFGDAEHRALSALARRAERRGVDAAAARVVLVPGIMGSQLGIARSAPLPNDILWLDPLDIQSGRLATLRLPGRARIVPLGIVLGSYLYLKLQLRSRGFAVEAHDYDWRQPVALLGRQLAARLRRAAGSRVALVAHSMGGLVARAALNQRGTGHVERAVLLGTPHLGSFAPVQALRGTYPVLRKVARLDAGASAEGLAARVFNSFPSLYDMLPQGDAAPLMSLRSWPRRGPRPAAKLLQAARRARAQLGALDGRYTLIAGVGEETVTALAQRGGEFVYTLTRAGDGTVPAASAAPAGARCLYAPVAHSDLTRDAVVAAAIEDVLRRGHTNRLPRHWKSRSRAQACISDTQLRRTQLAKVDWAALQPEERRSFLENLNEPPRLKLRVPRRRRRATRT